MPVGQAIARFHYTQLQSWAAERAQGQPFWLSLCVREGPAFFWADTPVAHLSSSPPGLGTLLTVESAPLLEGGGRIWGGERMVQERERSNFPFSDFSVRSVNLVFLISFLSIGDQGSFLTSSGSTLSPASSEPRDFRRA